MLRSHGARRTSPIALAIAPALLFGPSPARAAERFLVAFEAGPVWQTRNDFRIPGTTGTLVELAGYDQGPFAAARATLSLDLTERQSLRLLAAPLSVDVPFTPTEPIAFQDAAFPAGEPVTARYVFNSWRLTWYWRFPPGERWSFRLGFTGKVRDAEIRLQGGSLRSSKADLGFVPLVYAYARYQASERLAFELEADALAAPQGRAEDVSLKAVWRPGKRVWLDLGYRLLEGGADNDEVYTFAFFHYAVAGLRVAF
jgi:hypothetical protein